MDLRPCCLNGRSVSAWRMVEPRALGANGRLVEQATVRRAPPGLAAAVVTDDGRVDIVTSGLADLRSCRPITENTTFLWFSMTKIVTATAAMLLVDRGALDLDAPAAIYLPALRVVRPRPERITVRHLLAHSSGLASPLPIRWVRPADVDPPDPDEFLGRLLRRHRRLRFPPGQRAAYTNLGYLVLGQVVAAGAGVPFVDFVTGEVLEPLGMRRTGFAHTRDPLDTATGYWKLPPGGATAMRLLLPPGIVDGRVDRLVGFRPFYVNGPSYGGLVGDVSDAARFVALHLADGAVGERQLLSVDSARTMRRLRTGGKQLTTGLGWWRRNDVDDDIVEHLGGGGGYYNLMRVYRRSRRGVVMFGNLTRYPVERFTDGLLEVPDHRRATRS